MMLSSACSHRLLSLLNQAFLKCKEEEKQLEEQLRQGRALLQNRFSSNRDADKPLKPDDVASEPQEIQPSPEDLQEVELLNKALEKALKVRETSKTDPPSNKAPAPSSCPVTKERPLKALTNVTQKASKSATYHLNPPYKTVPDRRRGPRPGQRASSIKSAQLRPSEPPIPKKSNGGGGKQPGMKASSTRACSALPKLVSPPTTRSCPESLPPQKPSTLKEKGSSLRLPAEYQRAYMRRTRLWEKFFAIQDHLPASRPSFIQKLQTTFAPDAPKRSLFEIEEETVRWEREVRSWQQRADAAGNWQASGPARCQNRRSLLLLEALQEEVAKYQWELQNLQLVAEEYRHWAEKLSINTRCLESVGCPSGSIRSPPVLVYHHPSELCELSRSRLRVRELQQKIQLQKVFSEELLAEAQSWSESAPTSCLPFRAIYTQLCEGGDTFPVLVQDYS
ncbi:tubulin epsilon and delta complex protein 2 isoform X2 [Ranitomeya imitator]|uniref:tubulin epsilon and delta complex protein 2 isoform X2 n=1 Tax=Ranitomeya imitator TaxID=111125 RepID=UPI0037E9B4A0